MKAVKTQERLFEEFIDFQTMPKIENHNLYGLRLVYKSLQMMKTLTIVVWTESGLI